MSKVVFVTGASRGIGAEIAKHMLALGYTVIGSATSEKGISAIEAYGAKGIVMDVSDKDSITKGLAHITDAHGAISILINNAGITRDNLLLRLNDEDWDAVINTNLTGVFRLSKSVLKSMMKARFGRIITIGSVVGTSGNPGQGNYCAAKAGVIGFTKSLAQEIASRNITVNVVAPGFIESDMTAKLPEAQKTALLSNIPMGRMGQPSDIAHAVAFLASDGASYITGQTVHVNGGMLMA